MRTSHTSGARSMRTELRASEKS